MLDLFTKLSKDYFYFPLSVSLQERVSSSWRVWPWSAASRRTGPVWSWRTASAPRTTCCGSGSPGTASLTWAPPPAWASTRPTRRGLWACSSATWPHPCCGGVATETWCTGRPSGRWRCPDAPWWRRRTFTTSGNDTTRREKDPVPTRTKARPPNSVCPNKARTLS